MLIFEKNLFYDCTKKELEEIAEAIKEDRFLEFKESFYEKYGLNDNDKDF